MCNHYSIFQLYYWNNFSQTDDQNIIKYKVIFTYDLNLIIEYKLMLASLI